MHPKDITSLSRQFAYVWAENKKGWKPMNIFLTGMKQDRTPQALLGKLKNAGADNWGFKIHEDPTEKVFAEQKQNLVYLTADSENVI